MKEYVSGEGFHYLGRSYRLLLTDETDGNETPQVRLVGGGSCFAVKIVIAHLNCSPNGTLNTRGSGSAAGSNS